MHGPGGPARLPCGGGRREKTVRRAHAGVSGAGTGLFQPAAGRGYDYLIGSVHGLRLDGCLFSVDESPEAFARLADRCGGVRGLLREYYGLLAQTPERTGCDILGHFDLVTKFNEGGRLFDEADPRYLSAAREALDALAGRDVIFEINTGAMSRGYRSAPYPSPALLDFLRDRGGRICVTSDSHSASTILHAFPQARELAKSRGFREVWVLTKSGFCPEAL